MNYLKLFLASFFVILCAGCDRSDSNFQKEPIVYVSGCINQNESDVASLWKVDNTEVSCLILSDSTQYSYAYSVFSSGSMCYVAGMEYTESRKSRPILWIVNGESVMKIDLEDDIHYGDARSVFYSNNKCYVGGMEFIFEESGNIIEIPKLWIVDGTTVSSIVLSENEFNCTVNSISVSGSKCYAIGVEHQEENIGKLWVVDGTQVSSVDISKGFSYSGISVATSGSKVYIGGYVRDDFENSVANLWTIDGTTVSSLPLTNESHSTEAYSVNVSDSTCYLAGYNGRNASLWQVDQDSIKQILLNDEDLYSIAYASAIYKNKIYVAGLCESAERYNAVLWTVEGDHVTQTLLTESNEYFQVFSVHVAQ